ncbi:uncharacterized protein LOC110673995 [Aedes aegypti]|uniref:FLYWCH-type domain-containing protein n=1 Tax=Aedes aegypti TaxID=7159 RepID=A0A6I8U5W8_AEDAE|nr:uncharacterized protein LOC110673995 [Aedes aegypti]
MTAFCDYRMECLRNDKKIASHRQRKMVMPAYPEVRTTVEVLRESEQSVEVNEDHLDEDECEDQISIIHEEDANEIAEAIDDDDDDEAYQLTDETSNVKEEPAFDDDHLMAVVEDSDPPDTGEASDMDKQEKVKKKRTRKVLIHDGHTYQLLSSRPKCDSITWGCIWRKTKGCRGTLGTKASGLIIGNVIPQHNHPVQPVDRMKQRKSIVMHAFREVENVYLNEPYEIIKNRIGGDMLVYNGDRYPYSHSRKDGCRIWKCSSHRKCTVSIYLCPDGRIFKLANSQHSEEKILQKRSRTSDGGGKDSAISDASANIEEIYPNPKGNFNYKIVKNANKRNVLIYEGDRYTFYYKKPNGWVVWRCTMAKGCMAMIYQLCDESVVVLGETTHNHLSVVETW